MDAGSILGGAFLLLLGIAVLQICWRLLLILLVLGPPTLVAMHAGHFVGMHSDSALAGFLTAVCVAGMLGELARSTIRKWRTY